jgi:mono/diheme cytochrome c family protein
MLLVTGSAWAADPVVEGQRLEFFETNIRPVFVEHCYECHGADAKKLRGGLLLDSRQGLLEGGESGPAVVPGDPEESLLISALKHDDLEMPPKRTLPPTVVADFEKWI